MARKLTSLERKIIRLELSTNKLSRSASIAQKRYLATKLKTISAKLDEVIVAETVGSANIKMAEFNAFVAKEFRIITSTQEKQLTGLLSTVYNETREGISSELGVLFDTTNDFQLRNLLQKTDDGLNYSQRLYRNNSAVAQRINNDIARLLYQQASPTDLKRALTRDFNISYNAADRLFRTEASSFYNSAAEDSYREAGIIEVEWLTEEDDKTCDICGPLDGQRFPIGTVHPPGHPNCRCTILPVIED